MTLPLPGREVTRADRPRGRTHRTTTGQAFFVGEAAAGPVGPNVAHSFDEFTSLSGARVSYSPMYDSAETFFREGGATLHWARVVSAGATTAGLDLLNGDVTPVATLRVQAAGPGAYANAWEARVVTNAGDSTIPVGSFRIEVRDENDVVIAATPAVEDEQAALAYAAANWVKAKLVDAAGTGDPVARDWTALAGGVDDRAGIVEADWATALDRFDAGLGPGQVAMPGRTTSASHLALLAHARLRRRFALLDAPDTAAEATLNATADAANAAPDLGGRHGRLLWPWAVAPGLTPYSTRTVPFSAVQAALDARVDALGNPNEPSAGEDPRKAPRWIVGLSQANPDDELRRRLNDRGVNVALVLDGRPVQYGNRTLRRETQDPLWLQASGSRCIMAIEHAADGIIRRLVHEQNQKGVLSAQLAGELAAELGSFYDRGALFGESPEEAFAVDAGPNVNTSESIAAGLLKASVAVRVTPGADRVVVELARAAVTEAVA